MNRNFASLFVFVNIALINIANAQTCRPGIARVAPDSRYIDHGNGTVTDSATALMWTQCSEGQTGNGCTGTHTTHNWQAALNTAAGSTFANYIDWRLPNAKELQSLGETGCHSPSVNLALFPNTPAIWFWTSTSNAPGASKAWGVNFDHGNVLNFNKSTSFGVRLVRDGL